MFFTVKFVFVSMSWSFSLIQVGTFCPKIPLHTLMACNSSPQHCVINVLTSCTTVFTVLQIHWVEKHKIMSWNIEASQMGPSTMPWRSFCERCAPEPLWPEKPPSSSTRDYCCLWKHGTGLIDLRKICDVSYLILHGSSWGLFWKPTDDIQRGVGNCQHSRDRVKYHLSVSW